MNLELIRKKSSEHSTIGELYIDGGFECFTLEDVVREVPGQPVETWKVKGKTAIPQGRYKVTITASVRFGRDLPLLNDVPGFSGVRIHTGNTSEDTEGCILVGSQLLPDTVVESRKAFHDLFEKLQAALSAWDSVWITIGAAQGQVVNTESGFKFV